MMYKQMKNVSVVLCTFNGEKYLRQQLDSVLAQTYPLYELIIQDDGSTDGTKAVIADYASRYTFIKYYENEAEHGVNGNFYSAMRHATGDLIAICDQDDVWQPDKLALQVEAIGDKMLCGGRSKPFSGDGSFVYDDPRIPNITLLRMLHCAEIAGHTMLVRRELIALLPSPQDSWAVRHRCYDIVFSVVAAAFDSIVWLDRVLVEQRRHALANTYTSTEDSLPTAHNAVHMLGWCMRHYKEVKQSSYPYYHVWEELLKAIDAPTAVCKQGIKMMQLQSSSRLLDFFRLAWFCLQHREEICHTRGKWPVNAVRALLFPLTSCYYWRGLIRTKK